MENCLVTKLKSTVNNGSLDKLGVFKLWFKHPTTTTGFTQLLIIGMEKAVITEGDSYFCDANGNSIGKTVTLGNGIDTKYYFFRISNAADCTIEIFSRYKMNGDIGQGNTNTNFKILVDYKYYPYIGESRTDSTTTVMILLDSLSELDSVCDTISKGIELRLDTKYVTNTGDLIFSNIVNSMSSVNRNKVTWIKIIDKFINGSLSMFTSFPTIQRITLNNSSFSISSELKSIGSLISLTNLELGYQTRVNGSLEEFVQAQIAAGRSTGTITMPYIQSTKVTWKGSQITGTGGSPKVSWTANSITYYPDGTTPDTISI